MIQETVLFDVDAEGVATITLNDPGRLNPLGEAVVEGLARAVERVREDEAVRALVLTGRGRGFSVGADLGHYRGLLDAPPPGMSLGAYVGRLMARINPVIVALRTLPVPVVCAVNGVAAGGGVGLALAGDLVVAARSSYFYLPFVPALGAVPDMGSTWVLPRTIGRARALGLALTGYKLPAATAQAWGLIWDCVDDECLAAEAGRLARQLAALPAGAVEETRAILAAAEVNDLPAQLALERERQMALVDGPDFAEGVRAFAERRAPAFRERRRRDAR